jgi:hypothetical protein
MADEQETTGKPPNSVPQNRHLLGTSRNTTRVETLVVDATRAYHLGQLTQGKPRPGFAADPFPMRPTIQGF